MSTDRPADRDSDTPMDADTVVPVKKLRDSVTGMSPEEGAGPGIPANLVLHGLQHQRAPESALPTHIHRPAYLRSGAIACYDCGMRLS